MSVQRDVAAWYFPKFNGFGFWIFCEGCRDSTFQYLQCYIPGKLTTQLLVSYIIRCIFSLFICILFYLVLLELYIASILFQLLTVKALKNWPVWRLECTVPHVYIQCTCVHTVYMYDICTVLFQLFNYITHNRSIISYIYIVKVYYIYNIKLYKIYIIFYIYIINK